MPIIRRLRSAPFTSLANVRSAGPSGETGAFKCECWCLHLREHDFLLCQPRVFYPALRMFRCAVWAVAPMSVVDSEAVFAARCAKVGLSERAVTALRERGWGTYANFAFSAAVVPGQGGDSIFVRDVITAILGSADHASAAALRRLHFESCTLTAAELKRQTEATESDVPRKLPPAEIASRIDTLQAKVLPLRIEDSLEPSHAVVSKVCQCVEDQRVRYIDLCRVTTWHQEVDSLKEVPSLRMLQPDRAGVLKAILSHDSLRTKVDTELEVFQALRRRGIAYELGGYMSFAAHESLVCFLIRGLQKEPLPGCGRVTLNQPQAAGREAHVQLAGFATPGPGKLPLDDHRELELEPLQESARWTAEAVLDLLGWRIAQGAKALPFATSFNMFRGLHCL